MAYNEQIKNLKSVRSYIRQFFVGGFKETKDYIYDNKENETEKKTSKSNFRYIKKKIDNCLGQSMKFESSCEGKIFLTTDSKTIKTNPFYDIFKAKSFTENDIILRFLILDYLADGKEHTFTEISKEIYSIIKKINDDIYEEYKNKKNISNKDDIEDKINEKHEQENIEVSKKTIVNKIEEFTEFGLITERVTKKGAIDCSKYSIVKHSEEELKEIEKLKNAIAFFSEADPLGVIGYYIMEMFDDYPDLFRFKQKYIFRAIDSEVLYQLVCAIESKTPVEIEVVKEVVKKDTGTKCLKTDVRQVFPYKIYISSQSGRQHLFYWEDKKPAFVRIDQIETVKELSEKSNFKSEEEYKECYDNIKNNFWGVSSKHSEKTERIEFIVKIGKNEQYILDKLKNEKRCGKVEKVEKSENLWKFSADVYDTLEIVVWIRTFIGRLHSISCENKEVLDRLKKDFKALCDAYDIEYEINGGDNNVIS